MNNMVAFSSIEENRTPIEIALEVSDDGTVTARQVYEFLGLRPNNFARWCKMNIVENEFAEKMADYQVSFINEENPLGGRPSVDYKLAISFAKKLCMKEHNDRGEQARDYFIKVEEMLKMIVAPSYQINNPIERAKKWIEEEQERQRLADEKEILEIALNESLKFYTVAKYNDVFKCGWELEQCKRVGKNLSAYCRSKNIKIEKCMTNDERFKSVNSYPITAWEDFIQSDKIVNL